MPVSLLDRIPLPSLQTYTLVSCSLFSCAVYYSHHLLTDDGGGTILPFIRLYLLGPLGLASTGLEDSRKDTLLPEDDVNATDVFPIKEKTLSGEGYTTDLLNVLLAETWCLWTMINMTYCVLILLGKIIQKAVFGKLRVAESQRFKDKFWNFVFYKFIFVFGVMNVQQMDEVTCWAAWFTTLGFLHLFSQLCKDRFEYLSFSPTTPNWMHAKVLGLLIVIQVACGLLTSICVLISFHAGMNTFAFMVAECIILSLKTLHVIIKYVMHLYDLNHDGVWENRGIYVYYLEFMFEMTILSIDFMHHVHMLVWGNIFLSMASLVICMQLRFLFHEFQRRWKRHKNYLRVVSSMAARFPLATAEELKKNNDECAICWEKMENARKLECGHLFHNACLRSWLEQETSCPICRASLGEPASAQQPTGMAQRNEGIPIPPLGPIPMGPPNQVPGVMRRPANYSNHFFHFDASRYISWLPSFSVEVTHTQFNGLRNATQGAGRLVQTSLLDNMVRSVQEVFPAMPADTVAGDLRLTNSVEMTIENIIEGRLTAPPVVNPQNLTDDGSSTSQQDSSDGNTEELQPSTSQVSIPTGNAASQITNAARNLLPSAAGLNLNFNFYSDDHIAGLSSSSEEDEETDEEETDEEEEPFSVGGRFSKCSTERESILSARKDSLLAHARRKFLSKQEDSRETKCTASSTRQELDSTECQNEANCRLEEANQQALGAVGECSDAANAHCDTASSGHNETYDEEDILLESSVDDDPITRRELMLQAVQRRLQQQ